MPKFLLKERLMPVREVCLRFRGTFSDDEIERLELQAAKVTPFLTGDVCAQSSQQVTFINSVLLGVPTPKTPSEIIWRRFVAFHKLITAEEDMRVIKSSEDTVSNSLRDKIARLEEDMRVMKSAEDVQYTASDSARDKITRLEEELSRLRIQNKALWSEREELHKQISSLRRAVPQARSVEVNHEYSSRIPELPDWREQL